MPEKEKLYVFFHHISWICPACGTKTVYQRHGLDGMNGEGQYCVTCKKFLQEIVPKLRFPPSMTTIESELLHKNTDYIQQQINESYKNNMKGEEKP